MEPSFDTVIGDLVSNSEWSLPSLFVSNFLTIFDEIRKIVVCDFSDSLTWRHSSSGVVTCADSYRSLAVSPAFCRKIRIDGSITDLWLDAMEANFSSQISQLWRTAIVTVVWVIWTSRNRLLFDNEIITMHSAIAFIWCVMGESNLIAKGPTRNSVEDLDILKCLHVQLKPPRAPRIVEVHWRVPPAGWLKVNTDSAACSNPGLAGCSGVFCTSRGFFKGIFAVSIGKAYVFEAELVAAIHAVSYAWDFGWKSLWLESDSAYLVALFKTCSDSVPWCWKPAWRCCLS
ncbi:Ribonuclease H-like domain containing protein [Trema orientale]|uniref:Ribonuclease H-like domain containing protein n=1 Tax=Trema orientale TaxID=63057 RepID=A0A2P5EST2_TREOI|nr:Ribonuclease H-like domain containing protein [Trema orientale]